MFLGGFRRLGLPRYMPYEGKYQRVQVWTRIGITGSPEYRYQIV